MFAGEDDVVARFRAHGAELVRDIRQTCDDNAFTREDGVSGPQTA
jgi:hypothetical protein